MSRTRLFLATAATAAILLLVGAAGAAALPFGGATGEGDVLQVGGDVKEPVVLTKVAPVYPEEARKNGIQGVVKLSAVVDEKGLVSKVEPVESPDPSLAQAAVDAVKRWTYKPATLKGKPVKVIMTVTVNFRLA